MLSDSHSLLRPEDTGIAAASYPPLLPLPPLHVNLAYTVSIVAASQQIAIANHTTAENRSQPSLPRLFTTASNVVKSGRISNTTTVTNFSHLVPGSLWCSIRFVECVFLACSGNELYLHPRQMSILELDVKTTHITFYDHVAYLFNPKTVLSSRPFTEDYGYSFEQSVSLRHPLEEFRLTAESLHRKIKRVRDTL